MEKEKLRLSQWAGYWLPPSSSNSAEGRAVGRLDPKKEIHQHAVTTLARIAAVFADIETFNSKYGLTSSSTEGKEKGWRQRLLEKIHRPRQPVIDEKNIDKLESSLPLALQHPKMVPELKSEVTKMSKAAEKLQQSLPAWHKLRWAVTDKNKL
jgi:hypothetical protein